MEVSKYLWNPLTVAKVNCCLLELFFSFYYHGHCNLGDQYCAATMSFAECTAIGTLTPGDMTPENNNLKQ